MHWSLFCRVIDNHGDLGVCWRLAAALAQDGHRVTLWVDDARALAWMAPQGAPGVTLRPFEAAAAEGAFEPNTDVVVEAFGCDPPAPYVAAMAATAATAGHAAPADAVRQPGATPPPVWINLEYLSAEGYVARSHGLPSPQANGLTKWFYYPGFTPDTGGLGREEGLAEQRAGFPAEAWLQARLGLVLPRDALKLLVFCYDGAPLQAAVDSLLARWPDRPLCLLATPGPATRLAAGLPRHPRLQVHALPWLPQREFDALLWASDLAIVRGEDSFVRAHWAQLPFVWHIYPQDDGAHAPKLRAWLDRVLPLPIQADGAGVADGHPADPTAISAAVRQLHAAWNGLPAAALGAAADAAHAPGPSADPPGAAPDSAWPWPSLAAWRQALQPARDALWAQPPLHRQLQDFVRSRAVARPG